MPEVVFNIESTRSKVIVHVSQNCGRLSESTLNRLFEPPQISPNQEHSHALNLYLTQMILEKSFGGQIQAKNQGNGVHFKLVFPRGHQHR